MKKLSLIIILAIITTVCAEAQYNQISVQYSTAMPFSDLSDYTGKTSFRGIAADYYSMLTPSVGLGFEFGWNVFYEEKGFTTFTDGTEALSGYQYRYSNNAPILISGAYYFMPEQVVNPYASMGVGAVYSKRDTDLGSIRFTDDTWHFALQPEIGVIYQFSNNVGAKLSANYNYMFENDDFDSQSLVSVNLGLVFRKL